MTFRPIHFQPMHFQPLTISTYCIFKRPHFDLNLFWLFSPNSVEQLIAIVHEEAKMYQNWRKN